MMRRFYATSESFGSDSVELDEGETRHLRDVLRLATGDRVRVFDGRGREFEASVEKISKRSTLLHVLAEVEPPAPESPLALTLAVAMLKGEKFDLVVQKAVELGVASIVPLLTSRGDVKIRDASARVTRWRRIALEAAKQCGRATLAGVDSPMTLDHFVREPRLASAETMIFAETGGQALPEAIGADELTVLIGPEGGWEAGEVELAHEAGFRVVTLGGRILRAETAAIAAAAIAQHRFGDVR